ncbi:hypothetical protein BLOT_003258 [Blomia tropicalis]|nr:hypothetical protein BLOT_003258 [Blomia tropicalis]
MTMVTLNSLDSCHIRHINPYVALLRRCLSCSSNENANVSIMYDNVRPNRKGEMPLGQLVTMNYVNFDN